MKKLVIFAILVLGIAPLASAQWGSVWDKANRAKDAGEKINEASQPWTPEQEDAIGRAAAAKLIHIFGLYDNPDAVRYVNLVGGTLAQNTTRGLHYKFGILDTEVITALAMPGGYVFITRGALANMKNEAELAGVLAHEIEHVEGRHLEKMVRSNKIKGAVADVGWDNFGSRVPGPSELKDIGRKLTTMALMTPYTPAAESEADRNGLQLAAQTGYDALGLPNFLQVLAQAAGDPANERQLALWGKSHPPFNERVKRLTDLAKKYKGGQTLEDRYAANVKFNGPSDEVKAGEEK